ncbi:unnamed protein product [Fraxinus pennsylvanica]|uniref:Glycoside hydrolase family 3 N-terminal domain-containing protein n=1 Tax=Fraxinus pennsylvanica TaxID=56036 RepID=A0AAD1ZJR1_9LAMI|nr:unnamed protein product [Fraxinus pennsylvanica]
MFSRVSVPILGLLLLLCASALAADSKLNTLYKDLNQPMNTRIKVLMDQMTLEEKITQMAQIDRCAATAEIMRHYSIGSLLSGGGSVPHEQAKAEEWVDMVNGFMGLKLFMVCRDPEWGRCYESYSEDPKIVQEMIEIIPGLQGDIPANSTRAFLM